MGALSQLLVAQTHRTHTVLCKSMWPSLGPTNDLNLARGTLSSSDGTQWKKMQCCILKIEQLTSCFHTMLSGAGPSLSHTL